MEDSKTFSRRQTKTTLIVIQLRLIRRSTDMAKEKMKKKYCHFL